jgi:hypothetical protein
MKPAVCHFSGAYNLEVASIFLENLWTPALSDVAPLILSKLNFLIFLHFSC